MSILSGDELNERMEGSTSASTGETYETTSDGYTKYGDTYVKHVGGDTYISKKSGGRNGRSDDHAHYYNDEETGEREVSVSRQVTNSYGSKDKVKINDHNKNDLFAGVKYFLGLD
jgi:hypothetical protein